MSLPPLTKSQADSLKRMMKKMEEFRKKECARDEAVEMLKEQHEKEIKLLATYLYYVKYKNGKNK